MSKTQKTPVVITAPKITSAWLKVVEVTGKNEVENIKAVEVLVGAMKDSQLSIRDIQKVIKETNRESATLKVSHIEGLITWSALRAKFADFRELPLTNQLAQAVASYKLLGAGNAEKMPSLEVLQEEVKSARKAKNSKNLKPKNSKTKTTNKEVLSGFLTFLKALNAEALTDAEIDLLADISLQIIELEPVSA